MITRGPIRLSESLRCHREDTNNKKQRCEQQPSKPVFFFFKIYIYKYRTEKNTSYIFPERYTTVTGGGKTKTESQHCNNLVSCTLLLLCALEAYSCCHRRCCRDRSADGEACVENEPPVSVCACVWDSLKNPPCWVTPECFSGAVTNQIRDLVMRGMHLQCVCLAGYVLLILHWSVWLEKVSQMPESIPARHISEYLQPGCDWIYRRGAECEKVRGCKDVHLHPSEKTKKQNKDTQSWGSGVKAFTLISKSLRPHPWLPPQALSCQCVFPSRCART